MRLPSVRPDERQSMLFAPQDVALKPFAARYYTGDFFEELTATLTRGQRLQTDSRADICPDSRLRDGTFAEVKSVGKTGTVIFYKDRHENTERFSAEASVWLFLWHHRADPDKCGSLFALNRELARCVSSLTVIDWRSFSAVVRTRQTREFFKTGKRREGWTVPLTILRRAACRPAGTVPTSVRVYGETVTADVPLFVSDFRQAQAVQRAAVQKVMAFQT